MTDVDVFLKFAVPVTTLMVSVAVLKTQAANFKEELQKQDARHDKELEAVNKAIVELKEACEKKYMSRELLEEKFENVTGFNRVTQRLVNNTRDLLINLALEGKLPRQALKADIVKKGSDD